MIRSLGLVATGFRGSCRPLCLGDRKATEVKVDCFQQKGQELVPVKSFLFTLISRIPQPTQGSFFPLASVLFPTLSPTQSALPPTSGPLHPALLLSQPPAGWEWGEWYVWSTEGTESGPSRHVNAGKDLTSQWERRKGMPRQVGCVAGAQVTEGVEGNSRAQHRFKQ